MTFHDLLVEIKTLRFEESRSQTEEYFEAVISRNGLEPLHKILTSYFGVPLKPEGQQPSWKASRHAKPHGGIRTNQTMYFRQDGHHSECVLLWPWGSGTCVTVKIIQYKNARSSTNFLEFLAMLFTRK